MKIFEKKIQSCIFATCFLWKKLHFEKILGKNIFWKSFRKKNLWKFFRVFEIFLENNLF